MTDPYRKLADLQRRQQELQTKLLLWTGVMTISSLAALAVLLMRW